MELVDRIITAIDDKKLSIYIFITGVKQYTFRWLISHDITQKEMVLSSLIIHH